DDEINEDIAAAMGFSSFGGTKKRKYDQANSAKTKVDASGANSTKLGVRPKIVADGAQSGVGSGETKEAIAATDPAGDASQSKPPSASNLTNTKAKPKQKQPATSGLATFLNRGQNLPDKRPKEEEPETAAARVQQPRGGHPDATDMISFGGEPISRAELNALRSGVKDENGDTAYFLPSFVEDPWANM
ncbi:hypothetical protein CC80DRAFT_364821, partial [Byssothecium circinans]